MVVEVVILVVEVEEVAKLGFMDSKMLTDKNRSKLLKIMDDCEFMHWAVRHDLHKVMKVMDKLWLPSVFLIPRVAKSLLGGVEEQPRSYVNYLKGLFRYAAEVRFEHRPVAVKAVQTAMRPAGKYGWWHTANRPEETA